MKKIFYLSFKSKEKKLVAPEPFPLFPFPPLPPPHPLLFYCLSVIWCCQLHDSGRPTKSATCHTLKSAKIRYIHMLQNCLKYWTLVKAVLIYLINRYIYIWIIHAMPYYYAYFAQKLPRQKSSWKGTYGRILIIIELSNFQETDVRIDSKRIKDL